MKYTVALSLLAFMYGCAPIDPNAGSPKPEVKTEPPVTTPTPKEGTTPQEKQVKGFNPNRLHQLADLEVTTVTIGKTVFHLWLMNDDSKRQEGMMFVKDADYKDDQGMLFVFSDEKPRSFWMQNTLVDLDIAYINAKGNIVSVHTMKSLNETGVPSGGPAMYALEAKPGLFKKVGIKAGMHATIDPKVKSTDQL